MPDLDTLDGDPFRLSPDEGGPRRIPRPTKPTDGGDGGEDEGPRRPKVERPGRDDLLRRMRKVPQDQARRYRQRTGE